MANCLRTGSILKCSCGSAPCVLNVLPTAKVMAGLPVASVEDQKPFINIPTFVMCSSKQNPAVIAVIAAKAGTKAPCVPVTIKPWSPGSKHVMIGGKPAATGDSKTKCAWGGTIQVQEPGVKNIQVK
ncbi:DUF4280 domain-containing protein [Clostridium sp. AM58-1XD]|uniref:DUF4280 domain-containing protein n=1 Tax=Clostridium sp. AM58-1XD TaxID=2292307 RepID=UPI000E51A4B2|nr:DUF4280 domain-containing protein [Clostridium sp. AM58-1XD]RGY98559.1 DUF4280 domain-containing protein [Clostridium sp. AM58-1XD]